MESSPASPLASRAFFSAREERERDERAIEAVEDRGTPFRSCPSVVGTRLRPGDAQRRAGCGLGLQAAYNSLRVESFLSKDFPSLSSRTLIVVPGGLISNSRISPVDMSPTERLPKAEIVSPA